MCADLVNIGDVVGMHHGRYGSHSPNCTNGLEHHVGEQNCGSGCLFNVTADPAEHINLKDALPAAFARIAARFAELTDGIDHQLRADHFTAAEAAAQADLCDTMWSNAGFYRPYSNISNNASENTL